jgi:hypothetical protein
LCACHVCKFDYRHAPTRPYTPYDASIGAVVDQIAAYVTASRGAANLGRMDVLHQFCKVMVSRRIPAKLQTYIAAQLVVPVLPISPERQAFELRSITERHHVIQLSAWLLADIDARLTAAWQAGAVRYNSLTREFSDLPIWYRELTMRFRRPYAGRQHRGDVP